MPNNPLPGSPDNKYTKPDTTTPPIKKPKKRLISSAYSEPKPKHIYIPGETKTEQHHADNLSIDRLLANVQRPDDIPGSSTERAHNNALLMPNFQDAQNEIAKAKENFELLSHEQKLEYNNDPNQFIQQLSNIDNLQANIKKGLVNPPDEVKEALKPKPKPPAPKPPADPPTPLATPPAEPPSTP